MHQRVMFEEFRADPEGHPLATPSGKIELFSEAVAAFGYDDCPGHATWNAPVEWMGSASSDCPLHLIGKQPPAKLHSQLDHGRYAESFKIRGHEPVEIHLSCYKNLSPHLPVIRNDLSCCKNLFPHLPAKRNELSWCKNPSTPFTSYKK